MKIAFKHLATGAFFEAPTNAIYQKLAEYSVTVATTGRWTSISNASMQVTPLYNVPVKMYDLFLEESYIEYRNETGHRHREDGPAVVWDTGAVGWYLNGVRHRLDGLAIETPDGAGEYWVGGEFCETFLEYLVAVEKYKQTQLTLV